MRRIAVGLGAVLLLAGVTTSPAVAAAPSSCTYERLPLPPNRGLSSKILAGDQTGKHLLGKVEHAIEGIEHPVLWTNGQPEWLIPVPGQWSTVAESVTNDGRIAGWNYEKDGSRSYWIYQAGKYQPLSVPADLELVELTSMNNRGDIVGYGWDKAREAYAPIVKPAGAGWRRLPNPGYADARKISDDGRVIGLAGSVQFDGGVVWDSFTAQPRFLPGKETSSPMVSAIRGPWIVGYEAYGAEWEFRGFRWPVNGEPATSFEGYDFASVNVDGDVVTSAERRLEGSKLIRFGGTEVTFDTPTDLRHLFDRGEQYTAAGAIGDPATPEAVVWKGC